MKLALLSASLFSAHGWVSISSFSSTGLEGKPEKKRFKEIEHWERRYVGHLLFCIPNHLFSAAPGGDEELRKSFEIETEMKEER